MKKLFVTLLSILAFSTAFSQTNLIISVCNGDVKTENPKFNTQTISLEKLLTCNELTANIEHYMIQSFQFSITKNKTVYEIKLEGNKFDERMLALLKEHNPDKVYLEKIISINESGEAVNTKDLILMIE